MYLQLYHKHLHSMLPSYNPDVGDIKKKGSNETPGGSNLRANVQIGRGGFLPPPRDAQEELYSIALRFTDLMVCKSPLFVRE